MKTTQIKNRILKPAVTKVNRVQLMEGRFLARRISQIAGKHQTSCPTATGGQLAKTTEQTELVTTIEAHIDAGFGNSLFIRGQGAELSWDKGQPLFCVDGTTWMWSTKEAKEKLVFKLLLNDVVWVAGDNLVAEPGKKIVIMPKF